MGQFVDLTGQRFNHLIVLELDKELSKEKKRIYWKCKCDCGREKSVRADGLKTKQSCGECTKNLVGQKFGRLTVLEKGKKDKAQHQYYICQCDCGNIVEINSDNLRRGLTQSCGCLHSEITHKLMFKDLRGQKFGKLTPISYEIKNQIAYWTCQCDCGNTTIVKSNNLINGHTSSCGCINYSIGEQNINTILKDNNINFYTEYKFNDLPNKRFDFYLPDYNRLIEFDGRQHYEYDVNWHQSVEEYLAAQQRDEEKNQYALIHHIDLIRIPYWERDKITIDMLLGNQYLINEKIGEA